MLHHNLLATEQETATAVSVAQKDISKTTWREGKKAPEAMFRGVAVVDGNTAYFRPANSKGVYTFQNILGNEQWSRLPDNHNEAFSLVVIDGLLTSVGGKSSNGPTNTLLSLTGEGERKQSPQTMPDDFEMFCGRGQAVVHFLVLMSITSTVSR